MEGKENKKNISEDSVKEEKPVKDSPEDAGTLIEKLRENPWVASTLVLGFIGLIFLVGTFSGGITGNAISADSAGENFVGFINSYGGDQLSYVSGKDFGSGIYEITVLANDEEVPVYVTKDGKYWAQALTPLNSKTEKVEAKNTFTEEENSLIKNFSSCLYDKGVKVYYAGWCGHCHTFIETFGGLENAGEMMVECQTADGKNGSGADLCDKENIGGFPTIKINGVQYSGARTFESLAKATGCVAPKI